MKKRLKNIYSNSVIYKSMCYVASELLGKKNNKRNIISILYKKTQLFFLISILIMTYAFISYNYIKFKICVNKGMFVYLNIFWVLILYFHLEDVKLNDNNIRKYLILFETFTIPFFSVFVIEVMCNPIFEKLKWKYIIYNYIIIFSIEVFLIILLGEKIGLYLTTTITLLFAIVNYFVIKFKGMPLMPFDFLAIKTAANVVRQYSFFITDPVLLSFYLYNLEICFIKYIGETNQKNKKFWHIKKIAILLTCLLVFNFLYNFEFNFGLNAWMPTESYYKYGSLFAFILETKQLKPYKVSGYSKVKAEEILNNYKVASSERNSVTPNIIIVMNESFSDLSILGAINTDVCLYNWKRSDYIMRGNAYASQYGGGTCNTEFEVLTGSTMAFIPNGTYPYQNYNLKNAENIIKTFKDHNYSCVAIHPASAENWNRKRVYSAFGFDEFLDLNEFAGAGVYHGYVSDKEVYKKIMEKLEDEQLPTLVFAVTMQNHGGYDINTLAGSELLDIEEKFSKYDQTVTYMTLIKESDDAFQELYDSVFNIDEPTIVCMFGDHQPNLGDEFSDYLMATDMTDKNELEKRLNKYIVPYIIFSNYNMGKSKQEQDLSLNYLGALLFRMAGYSTPYFEFVNEMHKRIPIVNTIAYKTNKYEWHDIAEENSYLDEYEIIQYYNLFER